MTARRVEPRKAPGNASAVKAVFFDFDGVLTTDKTGSLTTLRYLARHTGVGPGQWQSVLARYNRDLNLGRLTHDDIWPAVCEALQTPVEKALLMKAFESTPMNHDMMALARRLKTRYVVAVITDNKRDRIEHLKAHFQLATLFDPIVVSAEVGSDKASRPIFEHALARAGVRADESLFIDNDPDNLVAPRELGMRTVFFDDSANDVAGLVRTLAVAHGLEIPAGPS